MISVENQWYEVAVFLESALFHRQIGLRLRAMAVAVRSRYVEVCCQEKLKRRRTFLKLRRPSRISAPLPKSAENRRTCLALTSFAQGNFDIAFGIELGCGLPIQLVHVNLSFLAIGKHVGQMVFIAPVVSHGVNRSRSKSE